MSRFVSISDFSAEGTPNGLSFAKDCYLVVIEKLSEHWSLACSSEGAGLVPNNHLLSADDSDPRASYVDEYVENAISKLKSQRKGKNENLFLKKLEKYLKAKNRCPKGPAPQPPQISKSKETTIGENLASRIDSSRRSLENQTPDELGYDLVGKVRQATSISHNLSKIAVKTVLGEIQKAYPSIRDSLNNVLESLNNEDIEGKESIDCEKLRDYLKEIELHKEDTQQRSWACQEDESTILNILENILSILQNAHTNSIKKELFVDHCKPLNTIDHEFLENLFQEIEADEDEEMCNLLLHFLICFNLHFELPQENLIMEIIENKGYAKVFTEKLMVLFNRGDDPATMFSYQQNQRNSVIKLTSDIFSNTKTAIIFYTNDIIVLFDIIERQITNLEDGDQLRTEFLSLCDLVVKNTDLEDILDSIKKIEHCLKLVKDSITCPDHDRLIIDEIQKTLKK
ncbi:DgyrCDS4527 [Dimorphilus gyrociliatus]|uniref:DgyrCDS4527 n=1 Tax=Dimorphilus gyrociliatus TaxID=2664684 RepID=A0A7I8VGY1_9ANNE|nr:DgyrCDS4527 [Dimorphilus gyrociliatus]